MARGGAGVVHRARAPDGSAVAVKLLLAGREATPIQRRRLATEIQTLLRLRHPNLVALLDGGEHDGLPYLVMEWVEGETLAARLRRQGPLEAGEALRIVIQLCQAVAHCHAQGVLHRDLKPANVLVRTEDGAPLLTDFGLSKDTAEGGAASIGRTTPGHWLGTPGYWPPEQAKGELAAIGPRSDVYGLGALLYALLTGSPPQEGRSAVELLAAADRLPAPPSRRRAGIPAWLDRACLRALAPDPDERQAGPAELARELAAGRSTLRPSGAQPGRGAAAIAVALLLAGGAVTVALVARRASRERAVPPTAAAAPQVSAPAPPTPRAGELLEQARRAWRSGENERALELAATVLADPEGSHRAAAHLVRARALTSRGESAAARHAAGLARDLATDPGEVALAAGMVAVQDKAPDARELLDYAVSLRPGDPEAWFARAAVRGAGGDLPGSVADLDRVIALAPGHAPAHVLRAIGREALGDGVGALEDFDRAVAGAPRDVLTRIARGGSRQRRGDLAGAVADFGQCIALAPENADGWAARAYTRQLQGDLEGAIEDGRRAVALDPAHPAAQRNLDLAEEQLQAQRTPSPPRTPEERHQATRGLYDEAIARYGAGDFQGAIERFDQVLATYPESLSARVDRGNAHFQLGQLDQALADFDQAVGAGAAWGPQAKLGRGLVHEKRGDLERALADWEAALKEIEHWKDSPLRPTLEASIARVRQRLGR